MDEMGGVATQMPKTFAMFTAAAMASLALPGMSGFVGELNVFLGVSTSDAYSTAFKVGIITLSAVGLILTPIYLLSMLREVFYGKAKLQLPSFGVDANPREVFIAACLIVPIIGIGLYPKLATQTYDAKTVAVASHARNAVFLVAQEHHGIYSQAFASPRLPGAVTPVPALLGVMD